MGIPLTRVELGFRVGDDANSNRLSLTAQLIMKYISF